MGWNYLSIPNLPWYSRWKFGNAEVIFPTLFNGRNYSSMLWLKLFHVSKRGYWKPQITCQISWFHYYHLGYKLFNHLVSIIYGLTDMKWKMVRFCHQKIDINYISFELSNMELEPKLPWTPHVLVDSHHKGPVTQRGFHVMGSSCTALRIT